MGLEKVKEEILNKAKARAASILEEAKRESALIIKEARDKAHKHELDAEKALEKTKDAIRQKEMAAARIESKRYLLQAKKGLIDKAFEEAKKAILRLPEKEREKIIKGLLAKAENEIALKKVYCNKRDAKFISGYGVEEREMLFGLIAENNDSSVLLDYSFDTILAEINADCLQDVAKILFGEAYERH